MTEQNNNPSENKAGKGLDDWNQRLDRNLEPEKHGDELADLRAEEFSNELGSGDQSDEATIGNNALSPHDSEDNMARNHPHFNPEDDLDREE